MEETTAAPSSSTHGSQRNQPTPRHHTTGKSNVFLDLLLSFIADISIAPLQSSTILLRGASDYSIDTVSETRSSHAESLRATMSEDSNVAARV